ncbi:5-oxoprolinase subunit PxpA [Shivajiella indica]|uniref:5-oxoprolinase subunit PxpA n=1 Tax=Shivajiella indica TaxID=872115 RepID=A0ABW5B7I9_9BACT
MKNIIDINCDLGEGMGNDDLLMPYLDSCNIACGGHAGDEQSIRKTIRSAKKYGVKIGSHPSYPDRLNFGRKVMEIDRETLKTSLISQLKLFEKVCREEKAIFHHIKAHGALYNLASKDFDTASLIIEIIKGYFPDLILYCPPFSLMEDMATKESIRVFREVFADRSYQSDLSLVDRNHPHALLTDPIEVLDHVRMMVEKKQIKTIEGAIKPIAAETLCIHGDNPSALEILKTIKKYFNF